MKKATNQSYPSDGLDDPTLHWMQQTVKIKSHPEWGLARVIRWYPADGDQPQRLRLVAENLDQPIVIPVTDVDIVYAGQ